MKKLIIGIMALCASIVSMQPAFAKNVYDITKITTRSDMVTYLTRKISDHGITARYINVTCKSTADERVFAQAKTYTYITINEAITSGEQPKNLYKDFLQALTSYNNQVDIFNRHIEEFRKVLNALTNGEIKNDELADAKQLIQATVQTYDEARYKLLDCQMYKKALSKAEFVNTAGSVGL